MRTFVLGDIHGNFKALQQVIERSGINKETDRLIFLGDVCDGYDEVYECVEELLTFKHLINIKGNHDQWFMQFLNSGEHPDLWKQGGYATATSYLRQVKDTTSTRYDNMVITTLQPDDVPLEHNRFFSSQRLYYKDDKGRVFVHGGFYKFKTLEKNENTPHVFYWDRDLFLEARSMLRGEHLNFKEEGITEVFLGHTSTDMFGDTEPLHVDIIWNVDTGAGNSGGRLTIMDVDTHQFWQSSLGKELYPNQRGRY